MPELDEEELSSPVDELLLLLEVSGSVGSIIIVVPLLLSAMSPVLDDEEEEDSAGVSPVLLESATSVVVPGMSSVVTPGDVVEPELVEPPVAEVTSSPQAVPSMSTERAYKWVDRIAILVG